MVTSQGQGPDYGRPTTSKYNSVKKGKMTPMEMTVGQHPAAPICAQFLFYKNDKVHTQSLNSFKDAKLPRDTEGSIESNSGELRADKKVRK